MSWYTTKCKYIFKMIQIITKLNEIFSHILNMNWLYHFNYNWKVWLMWFHKKHLDKFFIQTSISVLKTNIMLKIYFHLKDDKNYVRGLCIKIEFYMFIKTLDEIYKKNTPNIYQNIPKRSTLLWSKMAPHCVLSPLPKKSQLIINCKLGMM